MKDENRKAKMENRQLEDLLKEINRQSGTAGDRKSLNRNLRELMKERREYYKQSHEKGLQAEFSDALFKILLLELDEEEEESIEIAELAYLGLGNAFMPSQSPTAEDYKRRLLLLHYFCDYFTDSIVEVFLSRYRENNMLLARNLAIECLEKMQLSDMLYLEENEPDFINGDEQIADACNNIATDPNLSETEKAEALLLHKVLYAYLKAKYKN